MNLRLGDLIARPSVPDLLRHGLFGPFLEYPFLGITSDLSIGVVVADLFGNFTRQFASC